MPSIVHRSPSLVSKGFALTDQTVSTEPTGLVRVALRYTFTLDKQPQLYRLFYPEAPPPESPSVAIGSAVGRLYMVNYSTQRENGLLTVNAEYVGAKPGLDANGRDIYTTTDYETQTLSIDLMIGSRLTNPTGTVLPPVIPTYERVYDRRVVRFTSAIKTEYSATDYAEAAAGAALSSLFLTAGQTTPDSLLLGAYWVNSGRLNNPDTLSETSVIASNYYDPLFSTPDNNANPIIFVDIPSQDVGIYQEPSALEFLRKLARSNNNFIRAVVATNLTVENASQNVRVLGQQRSLRFLGKVYRGDAIVFGQ